MDPQDFLKLVYNSDGIVGNSSCAIRECSFLGIPAVNIGTRQSNRERGPNVVDVDYDRISINKAINDHCNGKVKGVTLYGDGTAGEKIAKICSKIQLSFSKSINYL